jgi:hypothetical protein
MSFIRLTRKRGADTVPVIIGLDQISVVDPLIGSAPGCTVLVNQGQSVSRVEVTETFEDVSSLLSPVRPTAPTQTSSAAAPSPIET